jgi:hypothetical protein
LRITARKSIGISWFERGNLSGLPHHLKQVHYPVEWGMIRAPAHAGVAHTLMPVVELDEFFRRGVLVFKRAKSGSSF